ncbi:MAG: hypothetical protein EZS28_032870 [Streblomastix strix]|uniref:Uncharacterized protein n=1 Tax=Streblomastix strix TaxID=222440 RepID=A0A5J4UMT7_9EUKA|nr:MAG: hypothetical protein EZS28_032870 [Streblomastix strix]
MIDALSIIVMDAANHKFIITDSFLSKLFDLLRSDTKCNIPHEARLLLSWVTDNELMKRIEIIRDIVINDEEKEDENKNGSKESIKQQIDVQQEQEQNDTTEYQQQTNPHIQSVISQLPEFASIIKKIVSRDDLEGGRLIICEIANWITNEPEILELLLRRENIDMDKYFVLTGVAALNDLAACVDNHQILLDHNLVSIFAEFIHDEGDLWTGCTNSLYLLINIYQLGTKQTKQKLKEDMPIELVHELAQSENQQIANNAKFLAQLYQES